jgi:hypothetical protein
MTLPKSGTSFYYIYAAIKIPKHIKDPNKAIILLELNPPLFFTNMVRQSNLD